LEMKKWWYACRLFGMTSLKEGTMWCVEPLLGSDLKANDETTSTAR
jgi:hypothetical protein